jgi:two-component system cell cycle sensor histidine kinase/response regulator CckA
VPAVSDGLFDAVDRRALEERLLQAEKIESLGRLAGGIAHDFNNLLTAILGYTELLLSTRDAADPDRADLEEIQRAGLRAAALTQQLLAFSRKQVLMPRNVDLNQALAAIQSMLVRLIRKDIALSCHFSAVAAVVRIDRTQLEQAILNLVLNARDALPGGGHVRLEIAHVAGSEVLAPAGTQPPAAYVRLRVIDNGVGLSEEARAHLFEPFFTTKPLGKGTGLGLASVYGIVRQSNGFIGVESQPGQGTTFTMYFPALDAPSDEDEHPAAIDESLTGTETILLVEDESAVRVIIGAVLRRQGYTVLEAATPQTAIAIFDDHKDIDVLLTDVIMPEMSGPALAQRLVSVRPQLCVLFISGYTDLAIPINVGNPNVAFLSKPFEASVLAERVHRLLTGPRARRAE